MLFNSAAFLFVFLPAALLGFYGLRARGWFKAGEYWLLLVSLVFYSVWDWHYLPLLLGSMFTNYHVGRVLLRSPSKTLLFFGIAFNLALLGYFKYADFFIVTVNAVSGSSLDLMHVVLPIGISFITFEQIAYLVDTYRKRCSESYDFVAYGNFVAFFPQLIAGPIFHHREIIPQLRSLTAGRQVLSSQIGVGLFVISVGLFKKVVIADNLALIADPVFADAQSASFFDAWVGALAYTLQLYFDFSGYADMAVGLGLLFGIELPENFNSPYKALNISDFWRRWHMTLGRFLRDYLYVPLGGSRLGLSRTLFALLVTMFLGGLWHGAAWTFAVWGLLHGGFLVGYHLWKRSGLSLPGYVAWAVTFLCVVFSWVLFRADNFSDAASLWGAMLGLDGVALPQTLRGMLGFLGGSVIWTVPVHATGLELFLLVPLLYVVFSQPNTAEMRSAFTPSPRFAWVAIGLAAVAVANLGQQSAFIYFRF